MKRIIIISCLAGLCLVALAIWAYLNRGEQGGIFTPEATISNGQTSKNLPFPSEKGAMEPRLFELPVRVALWSNDQFSPCYFNQESKTLYRWNGVILRPEQMPDVYSGVPSGMRVLQVKKFDFSVVPVEAPIKYWYWEDGEGYRPGYLDRSARAFYAWKSIVLNKEEVRDKSAEGLVAIVMPDKVSQVIEIDIPVHLKEKPERWKKGGAYTAEAGVRAEKRAAEKKAAEKRAAEERARDPRVFTLGVWVTAFGENEFCPCYYDPKNRSLYRWKGVVLRLEQLPEVYKKRKKVLGDVRALPLLVVPVEAPVKYREVKGGYRPGYVDATCQTFYEWKEVILSKQELLDKSKDGQPAVVDPDKVNQVIDIDMPAYLKKKPALWKKLETL